MPRLPATYSAQDLLTELEEISELISQNTAEADAALKTFKAQYQPFRYKEVAAQADLLTLIIASVSNTFLKQKIDDKKLVAWFKSKGKYDEAAQVLLSKARHFFINSNLAEAEKVLAEVTANLLDKIKPRTEIVYFTRIAFLYGKQNRHDEQMRVNLLALDKLKAMTDKTAWHHNISTIFYCNIASAYINNSNFDKAWQYLQEVLEIAEKKNVSPYNKFNVYTFFAHYYEYKKNYLQSARWHEKIITLLKGNKAHQPSIRQSYLVAVANYHHYLRQNKPGTKKQKEIFAKQEEYLKEAAALTPVDAERSHYLHLLVIKSILAFQKKNYAQAVRYLNVCLPAYTKMKHRFNELNCLGFLHEVYYNWGKETGNAKMLAKAYEIGQKESKAIQTDSEQTHLQKMEAAQVKHNLQQSELNAKLLQQQIEAQNKEMQLTALNLQEKAALLDELKTFVVSLPENSTEHRKLIQTITHKIGSVKITEQEKAVLQQKIDTGNAGLSKTLTEKYPLLTSHEIRICGLLRTGMNDKELSRLYGTSERGYEQLRHRIKKKMKLKRKDNLVKHLNALSTKNL